jgi:uncharacterized circularly permuted ATP-grasp superfamily protein/uncharacterized alpha-E superfamily protein
MPERPLSQYPRAADRYDEVLDARGAPRAHWRPFLSQLSALPAETVAERGRFVRESIESDGVTYNVHADAKGASRLWELDPLPLILPAEEWRTLAAGVAQRARLLNAVLADLYGPQKLLAEGLLPPALVFGQRTYLWPCRGVVPPGNVFLHVYAADLARSIDGRFWILADRTRGPSGAGYALQNRMTLSRAFPDAFRELPVQQLAPFFAALQDTLYRLSPTRGESPLVVLLTPGPYNETYFEHSFLARHLGFPLVEGQDLLVRGDAVHLKTLRGLRRVHAILRRLSDEYCDPVELRADSAIGVPGLLHAVRAGNVVMANALGSGVLETGAMAGFMPAICERLLGEKLRLPAIATWWCGEAPALEYVIEHMSELVIKPTYSSIKMQPVFGHTLDGAERARLIERMRVQPHAYLAQEWVRLSHAPAWGKADGARFDARAVSLRAFAAAGSGGYTVLPGALTRVAPSDGDVVSIQWGGSSKDTWVLAEGHVPRLSLQKPRLGMKDVVQSAVDIPSRVGENLFWMGRYSERCEAVARLLRAALVRIADAAPQSAAALGSIATVCASLGVLEVPEDPSLDDGEAAPSQPVSKGRRSSNPGSLRSPPDFLAAVVNPRMQGGLAANVMRLVACANQIRERMSTDNWHVLGRLPQRLPGAAPTLGAALEALDQIMLGCVSLAGFAMDDMTRDESWRFLLIGRRLERLGHLAGVVGRVLRFPAGERSDALEWLLEAANSIVTFRARYRRAPELLPVLHLVVFDESNPHAVAFQVRELGRNLDQTAEELGAEAPFASLVPLAEALSSIDMEGFEHESGEALELAAADLAERMHRAREAAFGLSDELQRRFFTHAGTPAPLGIQR